MKKRIMIDMDEVICEGGFLKLVNEFLNTNYTEKDLKSYYIQDLIPKEKTKQWCEFFCNNNTYKYVNFLPNAYKVMEKLSKKYELYITTAYIYRDSEMYSGNNLKNKFEWLYKNLPYIPPQNYIFTDNKQIINCQIKIDDKISNLEGEAETRMLFTAYHNKNINKDELLKNGIIRVNNWKEIEKILI